MPTDVSSCLTFPSTGNLDVNPIRRAFVHEFPVQDIPIGRDYFAGLRVTKRNKATVLLTLTLLQTPTLTLTLTLILTPTLT